VIESTESVDECEGAPCWLVVALAIAYLTLYIRHNLKLLSLSRFIFYLFISLPSST